MAWRELAETLQQANKIASSPSSGKVLKVSSDGTSVEWGDAGGGAFTDNGSTATVTDRIVTITGSSSAIPTLDINPPSSASTASYSRIRVQTSGKDLRFNLRNGSSTSDVMTIAHDNKVGIGTTSPDRTLHVKGTNHELLKLESSDNTTIDIRAGSGMGGNVAYIQKYNINGSEGNRIYLGNSTDFYTKGSGGTRFFVSSNDTQALTIKNNANIGIGTNAPSHKFHINHSSSTSLGLYVAHSADEYGSLAKFYTNSSNNTARSLVEIHNDNASSTAIIPLKITQDADGTALAITNGKVGIGTTSPLQPLHIESNNNNSDASVIIKNANVDGTCGLSFRSGSANNITIGIEKIGNNFAMNTGVGLGSGTRLLTVTPNGSVGIGTSSPSQKLHVHNDGSMSARFSTNNVLNYIHLTNSGGANHFIQTNNHSVALNADANNTRGSVHLMTSNTNRLNVTSDGKIGIGTTSPSEKLHVAGNILLPLNASDTSHKLKLTATTSAEIYATSYGNLNLNGGLYNFLQSAYGTTLRSASSGGREILLEHSTNTALQGIKSTMSNFSYNAGHSGYFGFLTYGSTHTFKAIETNQIDNNTWDLKFNSRVSGTDTERMRITSAGNVGIGETAPTQGLTLGSGKALKLTGGIAYGIREFNRNANNQSTIILGGNGANANYDARIELYGQNANYGKAIFNYGYTNASKLQFQVLGNDKVVFSGNGSVGIGTSSPSAKLEVQPNNSSLTDNTALGLWIRGTNGGIKIGRHTGNDGAYGHIYVDNASSDHMYIRTYDTTNGGIATDVIGGADQNPVNNQIKLQSYKQTHNILGTTVFELDQNSRISLSNNTAGSSNSVFGYQAGNALASGSLANALFGESAGSSITTADYNTHIGHQTGGYNVTGNYNTSVGARAMLGVSGNSHSNNTAVGYQSLYSITTGSSNVAIGANALTEATTGGSNIAIGKNALNYNESGSFNVAVGRQSMLGASGQSHSNNNAIGYQSLYSIATGGHNNVIGYQSGFALTNGWRNNLIGYRSGYNITSGENNTALGHNSLSDITTTDFSTAIGSQAFANRTSSGVALGYQAGMAGSGVLATYIGQEAGEFDVSGSNNTSLGARSLHFNETGSSNTAVGSLALFGVSGQSANYNTAVGNESLKSITTGSNNTAVGYLALNDNTSAGNNVAIGADASHKGTTANKNVAVGNLASYFNETGLGNVSMGYEAMKGVSGNSHSNNVAIGYQSMLNVTTGGNNSALGQTSLYSLTTGTENTAIGRGASYSATVASENIAIGTQSLYTNTAGKRNVAIGLYSQNAGNLTVEGQIAGNVSLGYASSYNNVTGIRNTALGYHSMKGVSGNSHSYNTAVGHSSLYSVTSGDNNVAMGYASLYSSTTASHNVALGYLAGDAIVTGSNNTIIGSEALKSATGASANVVIGNNAGLNINNNNADDNVLIGRNAGLGGTGALKNSVIIGRNALDGTGANDTNGTVAIGYFSLTSVTSGDFNTAIGFESGKNQTTASSNTFIGYQSGRQTTGSDNVAVGKYTMYEGQGADGNTAIGTNALQNITGDNNVAVGSDSLTAQTSGSDNTSVGAGAGLQVTTGYDNTLLGKFAGKGLTTGDGNTLIGDDAGNNITQGRRNTVIGKGATTSANGALDQIVIGWGATGVGDTSAMIGGSQVTDVYMGDNGSSWSTTSDGRLKENIKEWTIGLDAINKLRIVEYNFKKDNPYKYNHKKKRQGIIAQEAIEAIPEMIKDDGEWLSANQEPMIWALVNAVQELTKKVNELETKLNKEN